MESIEVDVLVLGGGISGLWTLALLIEQGTPAILLEKDQLGCGQTTLSQGIIHGGTKFALKGRATTAAKALAQAPTLWQDCLKGKGILDLRNTQTLSKHHNLWLQGQFSSAIKAFVSSKVLQTDNRVLAPQEYPKALQNKTFKGQLCQLDETVIDTGSLIQDLTAQYGQFCYQLPPEYHFKQTSTGNFESLICQGEPPIELKAAHLVLTAGSGNESLLQQSAVKCSMQKRPLHMVLVKQESLPPLFVHLVGQGNKPVMSITSHRHIDGDSIWYLGGELAENGVKQNSRELIESAKQLLAKHLHWIDLKDAQWKTCRVDRAEMAQSRGKRPDSFTLKTQNNITAAWPTKLALAPLLAQEILNELPVSPAQKPAPISIPLNHAQPAQMIWDLLF